MAHSGPGQEFQVQMNRGSLRFDVFLHKLTKTLANNLLKHKNRIKIRQFDVFRRFALTLVRVFNQKINLNRRKSFSG